MAAFIKYFYPGINLIFLFQLLLIVSMKRTFLGKEDEAKCSSPLQFILPAAFRKGGGSEERGMFFMFLYLKCIKTYRLCSLLGVVCSYDDVDPRCCETRTIHHNPYISFLLLSYLPGELCGLTKLRNAALAITWGSQYDSRNYVAFLS